METKPAEISSSKMFGVTTRDSLISSFPLAVPRLFTCIFLLFLLLLTNSPSQMLRLFISMSFCNLGLFYSKMKARFEDACKNAGVPLLLRLQPGYDHSYYFIPTFINDHIRHHAQGYVKHECSLLAQW